MSTGSKNIANLEEVNVIDDKDQLLFFQNSTKKTKKITRKNLAASRGFGTSITGVLTNDGVPPGVPGALTVTTLTEKDRDGTEKVYIKAQLSAANSESDLAVYRWYLRRINGDPVFSGANLTGYSEAQIFGPIINETPKDDANALKMVWDVRANVWYEVAVSAVDKMGNASAYTALTTSTVIQSAKDTTAPSAPTLVSATSAIKSIFLSWTNSTDSDLAYVKIYRVETNTSTVPAVPTTGPAQTGYARIMSNSYVDSNTTQGKYYHYWLTSVDDSGNESGVSAVTSIQPGLVANTDITTFAVDATNMFTNTIILKGDTWADNSPSSSYIAWNAHTLVYGGASYDIVAGNTNLQFVYWKGVLSSGTLTIGDKYIIKTNTGSNFTGVGAANNNIGTTFVATGTTPTWGTGSLGSLSYTAVNTNPTLTDGQFMIATNADSDANGTNDGLHDLAWNAIANAVIGSAYIQNAAITNAKVNDMKVDKLTGGQISGKEIILISDAILKSSNATSVDVGNGLWIKCTGSGGTGNAEFALGDFAGTNYGYVKWKSNTLSIKGSINATSLTLNGLGLTGGDVGLGNVQNYNAADQTINGLQSTITINSGGIAMGTGGFVRGGINWATATNNFSTSASGFFLGYTIATAPTTNAYRFFIGSTGTDGLGGGQNFLYWDGSSLKIGGKIIGGTSIESAPSGTTDGLIINSTIGIRKGNQTGTLTITGGNGNGISFGAQIDFGGNELGNGNRGILILQGGSAGPRVGESAQDALNNGRIEFRTNTYDGTVGVTRGRFSTSGEFVVYKNSNNSIPGVYTTGAGCAEFQANVGIGRSFETIDSSGNTPGKLHVQTEIAVYTGVSTRQIVLTGSSGDVTAISFTTSSSKKFKTNIKQLNSGIETIDKLKPVSFKRKGTRQQDIGLIAEEVDKVLPVIVKHNDKNEAEGLDYSKLTVVLINAVKELSAEVKELKKKLKDANSN